MKKILNKLILFSRFQKQFILITIDSLLLIVVILASFSLRLDYLYWPSNDSIWFFYAAPFIAIPIFYRFGLYSAVIRFIGFKTQWAILKAVTLYAIVWGIFIFMTGVQVIPRSVILINWVLSLMFIGGLRMFGHWVFSEENFLTNNVVIFGAGSAGRQLSIAISQSNKFNLVAFLDDNKKIQKQSINGLEVLPRTKLEELVSKKNVTEVLLAMPSLSRIQRNEIIKFLESHSILVRSLPSLSDLVQGKIKVDDLLEIDILELLGRDLVKPNPNLLKVNITGKVVLITGAGGSIGSELCRQIILLKPKKIILFEVSEPSLYEIEQELINNSADVEILSILGSVTDKSRVEYILKRYIVKTVYHAAAYKHVPLVEHNPSQGVLNNTIGTLVAAEAAIASEVETFVLISTDKAVRPSSTMGVAKRVAELVLQALANEHSNTCFTMVRFGNVIDSSGSVIPLFKKQIRNGGPVTVTDINVVRYFMTIPEAVELVIQAGAMGKGGDVFVLDMGKPIKIYDLAVKMIKLSGLQLISDTNPKGDIEIKFTGLRPGEKLFEELLVGSNSTITENKLIMRAKEEMINWHVLKPTLNLLHQASINNNHLRIRELLIEIVPEFNPQFSIEKLDNI